MNGHACSKKEILCEPEAAGIAHLPTSAGTFSFRRAHYLTKTGMPLAAEPLTAEQQQALIELIREGDAGARRKMIANSMHLVLDFARHYANRGPLLLDLVREGNQGLIRALEKFEPEGGLSFSGYAALCVRQHIERAIMNWNNSSRPRAFMPAVAAHVAPAPEPAVLPDKLVAIGGCHVCSA
ncbi:MAG: hypothetical protein A3J49_14395 [Gallionellales bacterium RIFCSPHIGHO2_02_FULL_57_16]|nr:MAG: hypothetical protein A3J49_14395 [Gallionellales bacterium RIFCSPHIGHO2_02_FULL_57_16]